MSYAEDLHKHSPQYFGWSVQTVETAAATGGTAINKLLSHKEVNQIGIYAGAPIHFNFSTSASGTVSSTNDLVLPGTTLTFITVPKGVRGINTAPTGNNPAKLHPVYFNYAAVAAATTTVRIVEC